MGSLKWEIYAPFFIGFVVIFAASNSHGYTDPRDVSAINGLYAALGSPPLPGWLVGGGDPCAEAWQGVECVFSNITAIILNGANLGGALGDSLGFLTSIITIDLSDNHIGGGIPSNLPLTVRNLVLSGNQFIGSIPDTLSSLTQLSDMSLSNNHLTGIIPDAFQQLTGLINLDLSGNNLSGQLPPSMGNLSSIAILHLQDNEFSGTLDVLQDLPLADLNIENNLFSGPIPLELLNIPNFRKSGNPFNTTVMLSPQASPPSSSLSMPPSSDEAAGKHAYGPSAPERPNSEKSKKSFTTKKVFWFAVAGILIIVVIALGLCLLISRCSRRKDVVDKISKRHEMGAYHAPKDKRGESFLQKDSHMGRLSKEEVARPRDEQGTDYGRMDPSLKPQVEQDINGKRVVAIVKHKEDHKIDMTGSDVNLNHMIVQPPPPPPMTLPVERVIVNSKQPVDLSMKRQSTKNLTLSNSLRSFTISSLQQYTDSFSQENLVGRGIIGSVYRAELPDGKLLAIKKLDSPASTLKDDGDFRELLSSISKLQHPNIVEIVGYCAEHGQQLLVYKYCGNMTLHDALHLDDEIHEKLSWNARIRIALGAARALEYLHEICQPAVVHQNFRSANILLDDKLVVHVSDCGLAPLMTSGTLSKLLGQLTAYGYGAPELELGSYTYRSDIYSFGVVMLELLTGRKSFERSRPRGEQFLVRWAITQLHDIDSLSGMVDPSLNGAYPSKALSRFADIISRCVQPEPEFRPPMSEIVQDLLYMTQREL